MPGTEDLVAELKENGATIGEAAIKLCEAIKSGPLADRVGLYNQLDKAAEGVQSQPSESGSGGQPAPAADTPEGWKAEFEKSKELQAEFGSVEAYLAYKNGMNAGRVRVPKSATA